MQREVDSRRYWKSIEGPQPPFNLMYLAQSSWIFVQSSLLHR